MTAHTTLAARNRRGSETEGRSNEELLRGEKVLAAAQKAGAA